ncbi:MAG: galactokinase [Treponema sp.]|jgi:galactokinase|nr:galactokinase [Treponema sp.]
MSGIGAEGQRGIPGDRAPDLLKSPEIRGLFAELYGPGDAIFTGQQKRYTDLVEQFIERFGGATGNLRIFSSPGRSEIGGNHTDHNHGKVLAASIQLDCAAVAAKTGDNLIHIYDRSYGEDYSIDVAGDLSPVPGEQGSAALVRGIAAGFKNPALTGNSPFALGGFAACIDSRVLPGSGLSSSAAFEMLIGGILSSLYNDGNLPVEKLALMGQYGENKYWGKGSGLLDQMACGAGGLAGIDFENPSAPVLERIPFDFASRHYALVLVDTGGSHANLSGEYSAIPNEMKSVAAFFGREVLRGINTVDILQQLPALRSRCGDRAVLRALHFIQENRRVDDEIKALKENNFPGFLSLIQESGDSSYKFLQNVVVPQGDPKAQNIPLCLGFTEAFFRERGLNDGVRRAACRVHGGGFAGVIQAFLPQDEAEAYTAWMHSALGYTGSGPSPVFVMSIRPRGLVELTQP